MRYRVISFILFSIIMLSFMSCDETGVDTGKSISVSGQVVYDVGVASNVKVSVNDKILFTDSDGRFFLNDVSTPYDVKVIYSSESKVNLYKGITRQDPVFNIGEWNHAPGSSVAYIFTNLPFGENNFYVDMYFKPDDNRRIMFNKSTIPNNYLTIYWDKNIQEIKGKLILLYINPLTRNYDGYYEKSDITLNKYESINLDLKLNDFINPDDKIISGKIIAPYGSSLQLNVSLNFSEQEPISYGQGYGTSTTSNFSLKIPDNIPTPVFTYLEVLQGYGNYFARGKHKFSYGSNNTITAYRAPYNTYPVQGDSLALYGTNFTWFPVLDEDGIYMLTLTSYNPIYKQIKVYTKELNVILPDFSKLGFDAFEGSNEYYQSNAKYFLFSGIDDFVSINSSHSESHTHISESYNGKVYFH